MVETVNPKTGVSMKNINRILVYGVSEEQKDIINSNLPNSDIEVCDCSDCFTDIIATNYIALIINSSYLLQEHIDYFNEMAEDFIITKEKIIFVSPHPILDRLSNAVRYTVIPDNFELATRIKYILLDAVRGEKKFKAYSDTISQTIRVLSEIRRHPYITTAELADLIERTPRTVQRYITTLICAGEFIEYDRKKKGWFMFDNMSVLWGDYD